MVPSGVDWVQLGADIDGEGGGNGHGSGDQFGHSVSISSDGTIVAIGALYNDGDGVISDNRGHVRVYQYISSSWVQLGSDIDGEAPGDRSGYSVSLSADGKTVAIGANWNAGNGDLSGHVRVYEYDSTSLAWDQLGDDIDGEAAYEQSGVSVSLSSDGMVVAIGASSNSNDNGIAAGCVRVYEYDSSSWVQLGSDIDGEAAGDNSGYSVSLSADGKTVAIGAPSNSMLAGHVRVYEYISSSWVQVGTDIDGPEALDFFGLSVSLSADATTVAIGVPQMPKLSEAGYVRVYGYGPP